MTHEELTNLIIHSNAKISNDVLDELKKVVDYQESIYNKKIKRYDHVLQKIAFAFDRKAFDIKNVNPESFYVKILWGINSLT